MLLIKKRVCSFLAYLLRTWFLVMLIVWKYVSTFCIVPSKTDCFLSILIYWKHLSALILRFQDYVYFQMLLFLNAIQQHACSSTFFSKNMLNVESTLHVEFLLYAKTFWLLEVLKCLWPTIVVTETSWRMQESSSTVSKQMWQKVDNCQGRCKFSVLLTSLILSHFPFKLPPFSQSSFVGAL